MPGRPTIWIIVGQGPTATCSGICLDIFSLIRVSVYFGTCQKSVVQKRDAQAQLSLQYWTCLKVRFLQTKNKLQKSELGWSGGAIMLGKLPVPGRPTIWITVGQGPTALAVSAGGGCLDIFTLIYPFSPLSPSLWETARYRLKYCLKGPLNPKQPTNQHLH